MARRLKTRKKGKKGAPDLTGNPDFRARTNFPLPPVDEIEGRLRAVLTPGLFAARQVNPPGRRLRERILTLPVMAVLMVSLVWRQMPSLSEALRVVAREGLWHFAPVTVSRQALSQRLQALPALLFAQLYEEALQHLRASPSAAAPAPATDLRARFTALWLADGSTLEALRRQVQGRQETPGTPLGGKMLALVDATTRAPLYTWYTPEAQANEKRFSHQVLDALPVGGLIGLDLGWFSFPFFDDLTEAGKFFVTRLRQKTSYTVLSVWAAGPRFRDQLIACGQYRSNPCRHPLRLVSVLWDTTWYHYLTNVLEPERLTAQEVCDFYRRRWRIEEAFLLTKRLLGLSYLWVGNRNGVEIQLYATWLFYAVLADLCGQVATALSQPLEQISVEMVFRSLYHFARAIDLGENPELIPFLVHHAKLLGLVKAPRKRHKERQQQALAIWGTS
jgi:hypothetical protein